jgi:integrase
MVEVALFTGLRVSEVLGLTWGAIDIILPFGKVMG